MNAYETAQSLQLTGTDAEIVTALQATGLTHSKISIGDLLFLLRNRAMMTRLIRPADTGEKWGGSLINLILYATDSLPAEVSRSIETFFSHITDDRSQFFDTTLLAHSAPFWAMAQGFGDTPTMPTVADFTAVAALGGGWRFADLTTEQVTAQRAYAADAIVAAELTQQWSTLQNETINPAANVRADLIVALRSAADALEAG